MIITIAIIGLVTLCCYLRHRKNKKSKNLNLNIQIATEVEPRQATNGNEKNNYTHVPNQLGSEVNNSLRVEQENVNPNHRSHVYQINLSNQI